MTYALVTDKKGKAAISVEGTGAKLPVGNIKFTLNLSDLIA